MKALNSCKICGFSGCYQEACVDAEVLGAYATANDLWETVYFPDSECSSPDWRAVIEYHTDATGQRDGTATVRRSCSHCAFDQECYFDAAQVAKVLGKVGAA